MNKLSSFRTLVMGSLCFFGSMSGCSTTEVAPSPVPVPPVYTQVPHPIGMDLADLNAIFLDPKAPQDLNFKNICDSDFRKLEKLANSRDELVEGLRELVKQDPVSYHWCFYSKILVLEGELKDKSFVDEKQKVILDGFAFLAPLARIYASEFRDSRYLRMAIARYQKWSEWIFYRKLELTPSGTSELVRASNPFGLWRDTLETVSVLEKYHISNVEGPKAVATGSPPAEAMAESNLAPTATPSSALIPTPSAVPALTQGVAAPAAPVEPVSSSGAAKTNEGSELPLEE